MNDARGRAGIVAGPVTLVALRDSTTVVAEGILTVSAGEIVTWRISEMAGP